MPAGNQIHLLGGYRREEAKAKAGEAIKPGHLLELYTDGTIRKNTRAGDFCERCVAEIDALQGYVSDGVEAGTPYAGNAYADGSPVQYNVEDPGAESLIYLKAGQVVAIGNKVVSNGDGTVVKESATPSYGSTKHVIGVAMDALDLSASGATDTLLRIRWL